MALFRIAAAAGLLLVLAPEETRKAAAALLQGADDARRAAPGPEQAAEAAMAWCRKEPEACAAMVRKAAEAETKLRR
jgi:uncharacterized protein YjeT (DUF2065 family)